MSDARHTFLMFAPDLCNEAYAGHPLYERVVELFAAPFRGRIARPFLSTSGETLTIEESMTLRARTETAGDVGDEHGWSWSRSRG